MSISAAARLGNEMLSPAAPKATSQGSNAGGGGAFTAFTRKSAARAEPDTNASAVANKASFFMTIPITLSRQSRSGGPPRASDNRLQPNFLPCLQSGLWHHTREAKKASMCRLFRRSDVFDKCSRRVLHSHNKFAGFRAIRATSRTAKTPPRTEPGGAFLRINCPRETTTPVTSTGFTKKAAAMDAAASRKLVLVNR